MKTKVHVYAFDTRSAEEATAYRELCARMAAAKIECFETWGGGAGHWLPFSKMDGRTIELETAHIYSNQWNTAPVKGVSENGFRVFDWAQDHPIGGMSPHVKRGHWLEITDEMRAIRRDTLSCGYCGKYAPAGKDAPPFHLDCIGSEYLKPDDLHLLRMLPVEQHHPKRAPLTAAERAELVPLYKDAQLHGRTERDKARIAKARADVHDQMRRRPQAGGRMIYEIGYTWRTRCGTGRATYRPDWDAVRPWIIYKAGAARQHLHSLEGARQTLQRDYGCRI